MSKHNIWDIQFWPGMTSIHYNKDVKGWLESHDIQYVQKSDNTPNCPQIRTIENIWAFCKKKFSLMFKVCKSTEDLRKKGLKLVEISSETRKMLL